MIVHCDVASLYPSIMIEYGFQSRNIKDQNKYAEIRSKRLETQKEKTPMQAPMKIILNGYIRSYERQAKRSVRLQSNNVCLAGQLLMLDLIEKLEGHCTLAQSNTDGLFLVEREQQLEECKQIASEWERRTRLSSNGASKKASPEGRKQLS